MSSKKLQPHSISLVSVLLPTYNEAGNIADLIKDIHISIVDPHEIIVLDDNSPDGTSGIVQGIIDSGEVPNLRLLTRMLDRGLTKSLKDGVKLANGDTVVWMDCDFSMPPSVIPDLLDQVKNGYDIAVGSRFVSGGGQKKYSQGESRAAIILSSILNLSLRTLLFRSFRDYTSGFIAVRKDVLNRIKLRGDYGEYFMDLIFRSILLKYSIVEIPYTCESRRAGESKTAPNLKVLIKRGSKYLFVIFKLQVVRIRSLFGMHI